MIKLRAAATRSTPLSLQRRPLAVKQSSGKVHREQGATRLDAGLKRAWSKVQKQCTTSGRDPAVKKCKARSLAALTQLCQKVRSSTPDTQGCHLGAIAGLVKRVKKIAARARISKGLAGLFGTDRPVARYNAAVPGCLTQIQAGLLLSPLRLGLLKPVQPRTLELLRLARLITEREYRIVREHSGY